MNTNIDWKRLLFASIPLWVFGYFILSVQQLIPSTYVSGVVLYLIFLIIFYTSAPLEVILKNIGLWDNNAPGLLTSSIGANSYGVVVLFLCYAAVFYFAYPLIRKMFKGIHKKNENNY